MKKNKGVKWHAKREAARKRRRAYRTKKRRG